MAAVQIGGVPPCCPAGAPHCSEQKSSLAEGGAAGNHSEGEADVACPSDSAAFLPSQHSDTLGAFGEECRKPLLAGEAVNLRPPPGEEMCCRKRHPRKTQPPLQMAKCASGRLERAEGPRYAGWFFTLANAVTFRSLQPGPQSMGCSCPTQWLSRYCCPYDEQANPPLSC